MHVAHTPSTAGLTRLHCLTARQQQLQQILLLCAFFDHAVPCVPCRAVPCRAVPVCRRMATFYSRSRKERWCKGETSGNFIRVTGVRARAVRPSHSTSALQPAKYCGMIAVSLWGFTASWATTPQTAATGSSSSHHVFKQRCRSDPSKLASMQAAFVWEGPTVCLCWCMADMSMCSLGAAAAAAAGVP